MYYPRHPLTNIHKPFPCPKHPLSSNIPHKNLLFQRGSANSLTLKTRNFDEHKLNTSKYLLEMLPKEQYPCEAHSSCRIATAIFFWDMKRKKKMRFSFLWRWHLMFSSTFRRIFGVNDKFYAFGKHDHAWITRGENTERNENIKMCHFVLNISLCLSVFRNM